MNLHSFVSMIDYAVGRVVADYIVGNWFPHESKFIKRIKTGVVLYKKQSQNNNEVEYKKPKFDRRITSMRIFTHTKK